MNRRVAWVSSGVAVAVVLAGCTTTVDGRGVAAPAAASGASGASGASRVPGSTGASASTGATPADTSVPSGAPSPVSTDYPESTPTIRSYLYARDATYRASASAVTGTFAAQDIPAAELDAAYGYDTTLGDLVGIATVTVGGAAAEMRAIGEDAWALAPGAFWSAAGQPADVAGQAGGKWVALVNQFTGVSACTSEVGLLSLFEPRGDHTLTTGTEQVDGADVYVITDATLGVETVVALDTGRISRIRTAGGELRFDYPAAVPVVTAPPAAEVVAVPGL